MKTFVLLLVAIAGFETTHAQKVVVKGRNTTSQKVATIQTTYSMDQLIGKWQEVKRSTITSADRIDFTDSLQLNFNKRDSVIVRDGITISHKGYAAIENRNKLTVAGDSYTIRSLSKNNLVINDGEYVREFARKKNFYYEGLGKVILPTENISQPVSVDGKNVLGKWYVYRTQASPGDAQDSAVIKSIHVMQPQNSNAARGEINFTKNGITKTLPFEASMDKGIITVITAEQSWKLNAYKADGKEFIFGNQGGLVYFSKKL